jgi:hypothetical protein
MDEFHEVWWIYSPVNNKEWGGLHIAHFRKTTNGVIFVVIQGEIDSKRVGPRDWPMLQEVEHWYKVKQIPIPTLMEIMASGLNESEK